MNETTQTLKMKNEEKTHTSEVTKATAEVKTEKNVKEKVEKTEDKNVEKQKSKPKIKKYEAVVNARDLPMSTKYAASICKFVKGKEISKAISDLEEVVKMKKAVPMKGEFAHRKGKGIMSGKFPVNAAKIFINLLKSLEANANMNELTNPVISDGISNIAPRPYGKRGAVRKKRTHVTLVAREIKEPVKNKKSEKKEKKE